MLYCKIIRTNYGEEILHYNILFHFSQPRRASKLSYCVKIIYCASDIFLRDVRRVTIII